MLRIGGIGVFGISLTSLVSIYRLQNKNYFLSQTTLLGFDG